MLRIIDVTSPDINNGLGVRVTVWVTGCGHKCPKCHNRWLWKYNQGHEVNGDFLADLYKKLDKKYVKGITFSGGDPLYQDNKGLDEIIAIMKWFKENFPDKDAWLYTGFTFEEILNDQKKIDVVDKFDYLVEGRFVNELKDPMLPFRGSKNQRILKVKESLEKQKPINLFMGD